MIILRSLVLILALAACLSDLKTGTVKNWILVIGFISAVILHVRWIGGYGLLSLAAGGCIPLIPGYLLFHYRMLGAGDVKLLTVIGCLTGVYDSFSFLVGVFFCAGIISCILLSLSGNFRERMEYFRTWCRKRFIEQEAVPYRKANGKENFHMTVPILIAAVFYAGGLI